MTGRNKSEAYKDPEEIRKYMEQIGFIVHTLSANEHESPTYFTNCAPSIARLQQKRKKRNEVSAVPSRLMLDAKPAKPTILDPLPRVNKPFQKSYMKRYVVYLTAGGMLEHRQRREQEDHDEDEPAIWIRKFRPPKRRLRIFRQRLQLVDFQPLLPPFVPDIVRMLANSIELHCYKNNWQAVLEPLQEYQEDGKYALVQLVNQQNNMKSLEKLLKEMSHAVQIVALRLFLDELGTKPLNFRKRHLEQLSNSPLFDFFLRPNPSLREVVKHAALSASCVHVDTLAFMMIHLIHAWENAPNPVTGKTRLASLYGHLLFTFVERPCVYGLDTEEDKTLESSLFEVILETCDCHFWNQLTSLKMQAAFDPTEQGVTLPVQADMVHTAETKQPSPQVSVKTLDDEEKIHSCELDRVISFYSFCRPTIESVETMDTPKDIQSLTSMETGKVINIYPRTVRERQVMSFISQPVPHVLALAQLNAIIDRSALARNITRRFKPITKDLALICRSTADLLRDIRRYRHDYVLKRKTPFQIASKQPGSNFEFTQQARSTKGHKALSGLSFNQQYGQTSKRN
ncbi:hypothetical protein EG68_04139 [Paragonimus skrjabini miyazakii]|uniref:Uncharacterized protein n=1 Tax=Paragonimus skrjabini miyazakii TaxID=59628 RepID=A0A8S9YV03_9TREM|nr:hypothetical protein EG68_04139 [Paragonimus skrjabini miyazakii]